MTEPTTCHVCGRHATGIGFAGRTASDNRWLCKECIPLIEYVKDVRRWDAYEVKALEAVDDATSNYAAEHGTDIAEYDDLTRRGLWTCAIRAHQDEIRRLVKDGDAPW